MFIFSFDDYKNDLSNYIDILYKEVKEGATSVMEAVDITQELTDEYVDQVGERPDGVALERLGTILMNDVYSDRRADKMTIEEYPVESPTQEARRTQGRHIEKGLNSIREVPIIWAKEIGSDRRDRRIPTRDNNRKMRDALGLQGS